MKFGEFLLNESGKAQPKTKKELKNIIQKTIEEQGPNCDLNFIDVSLIKDMSNLFKNSNFNGDISKWDVSNVTNMSYMFAYTDSFNQPLDKWDVSNVEDMSYMFAYANSFNRPLDKWNTSKVTNMKFMFWYAESFNQSISKWNTSKVTDMYRMFCGTSSFNQSLDKWDTSKVKDMRYIFSDSKLEGKEPSWVKKLKTSRPSIENKRLYSTHF